MNRQIIFVFLVIFCTGLLVLALYRVASDSVYHEIRQQAKGVAVAMAGAIDPDDLQVISSPSDRNRPEFGRVSQYLSRIQKNNSDVRYAYTMRIDSAPDAGPGAYLYIVDAPAWDHNRNGEIDEDEQSELPGNAYDASDLPEMIAAWKYPSADREISPDPPYPDLMSGYAPIKNESGETIAILGVDILAQTVSNKLFYLRVTALGVFLFLALLEILAALLYRQREIALNRIRTLSENLSKNNRILEAANEELKRNNLRFERELELARHVQQGFLPKEFPFSNQLKFGQLSLFCEMLGGDLYDAFPLNDTHIGFYMADVSGHGVSAALISGLLKMGMETLRPRVNGKRTEPNADIFQPRKLIETLNQRIRGSIPPDEFITFCYCVYNTKDHLLKVSSAGHTPAIHYQARKKTADFVGLRGYFPLGAFPAVEYPEDCRTLEPGDKIVLYTDGITEAHSGNYDFYGETRLLDLVAELGDRTPEEMIRIIRQSVDEHVQGEHYHDDFSLLILQLLPE